MYNKEINLLKVNELNGVCQHVPITFKIENPMFAAKIENGDKLFEIKYISEIKDTKLETSIKLKNIYKDESKRNQCCCCPRHDVCRFGATSEVSEFSAIKEKSPKKSTSPKKKSPIKKKLGNYLQRRLGETVTVYVKNMDGRQVMTFSVVLTNTLASLK